MWHLVTSVSDRPTPMFVFFSAADCLDVYVLHSTLDVEECVRNMETGAPRVGRRKVVGRGLGASGGRE